jgi:hypothetical protein
MRSPCAGAALDPPSWTIVHNKARSPSLPPSLPFREPSKEAWLGPAPPAWTKHKGPFFPPKVRAFERSQEATGRIDEGHGAFGGKVRCRLLVTGVQRICRAQLRSAPCRSRSARPRRAVGESMGTLSHVHTVLRSSAYAARGLACALTRGALERQQVLHRGAGCGDADAVVRGVLRRAGYALPPRHAPWQWRVGRRLRASAATLVPPAAAPLCAGTCCPISGGPNPGLHDAC